MAAEVRVIPDPQMRGIGGTLRLKFVKTEVRLDQMRLSFETKTEKVPAPLQE